MKKSNDAVKKAENRNVMKPKTLVILIMEGSTNKTSIYVPEKKGIITDIVVNALAITARTVVNDSPRFLFCITYNILNYQLSYDKNTRNTIYVAYSDSHIGLYKRGGNIKLIYIVEL
jgi:hypothetical protein